MTELAQEKEQLEQKGALGQAAFGKNPALEGAKKIAGFKKSIEAYASVKPVEELR
jgi:hypothetical protein